MNSHTFPPCFPRQTRKKYIFRIIFVKWRVFPLRSARQMKVNFAFCESFCFNQREQRLPPLPQGGWQGGLKGGKKTLYLLKYIVRKISTHNYLLSKVFCLPHYYRKDVIPPTGVYK